MRRAGTLHCAAAASRPCCNRRVLASAAMVSLRKLTRRSHNLRQIEQQGLHRPGAHHDWQRVNVSTQHEARRSGSDLRDNAGPRDHVLVRDAHGVQLALQVRAGELLFETQLRNAVQVPVTWSAIYYMQPEG